MIRELWQSLTPGQFMLLLGSAWCLIGAAPTTAFLLFVAATVSWADAGERGWR